MPQYEVLAGQWNHHEGDGVRKRYRRGDTIELSEENAKRYLSKANGGRARVPSVKPVQEPVTSSEDDSSSSSSSSSDADTSQSKSSSSSGGSGGSRKVSSA